VKSKPSNTPFILNADSRLRNPVYWLLWSATAFLIAVLVFDWRPPEFLDPLFVASIFLPGIAAIGLLSLLLSLPGTCQ